MTSVYTTSVNLGKLENDFSALVDHVCGFLSEHQGLLNIWATPDVYACSHSVLLEWVKSRDNEDESAVVLTFLQDDEYGVSEIVSVYFDDKDYTEFDFDKEKFTEVMHKLYGGQAA